MPGTYRLESDAPEAFRSIKVQDFPGEISMQAEIESHLTKAPEDLPIIRPMGEGGFRAG